MSDRNNEERFGMPDSNLSSNVNNNTQNNSLSFVVPTEFVDLPSKGKFYKQGHPLHNKSSIEIRFMTAKEEDILTSKSLLKKGIAIDKMLESVIVDKNVKIDDLLLGDKNALIIAARITGYGSEYETKVTCPSCGASGKYSFDLREFKSTEGGDSEHAKLTENGTFKLTLPVSKFEVEVRLLSGADEKRIADMFSSKTVKNVESNVTDQFKMFLVSVNGNSSREMLDKFVEVMPAADSRFLRKEYEKLSPNVDLSQQIECTECGTVTEMEVPFTTDFFWFK